MAESGYRPVFAEGAAEFLLQLPRRRQGRGLVLVRQLASQPLVRSDYTLSDELGREIEHLMIDDFVFVYWLDHGAAEIRILDIEDAS